MSLCIQFGVHKVHQFGVVSLHWADTQKSYFLLPAEGLKAERERGCPEVIQKSRLS